MGVKEMMMMTTMMMTMMMTTMVVAVASVSALKESGESTHEHRERRSAGDLPCPQLYSDFRATHTRCLTDNPDAQEVVLGQDLKDYIVNYHNQLRTVNVTNPTAANMQKLVWDDTLALSARKLAMQCPTDHDQMKDRMEPEWRQVKIGQNVGMGHASFKGMLDRMFTERDRYNYVYGGDYVPRAGHYVQLVTARTNRVGCGYAKCPNTASKRFRVCNYAEALDVGKPPYENGAACSACPNHCDSSGKMCDCGGKLCYNNGVLDVATCQCTCPELRKGENCERVDCDDEDFFYACRSGVTPASDCGNNTDPMMCPHLCGLCEQQVICDGKTCYDGFSLDTDTCTCECGGLNTVVDGKCVPCASIQCQHGAPMQNCACVCGPTYTGRYCEFCLKDMDLCVDYTPDACDVNLEPLCPLLCNVCDPPPEVVREEEIPADYDVNDLVDLIVNSTGYLDGDGGDDGGDGGDVVDGGGGGGGDGGNGGEPGVSSTQPPSGDDNNDGKSGSGPQRGSCRVMMMMMMTMMLTTGLTIGLL